MRTTQKFTQDATTIRGIAGVDLSALKDTFVMTNAAGEIIVATATDLAIGVLKNAPVAGAEAIVQISGVCSVNAEEAISAMDILAVGTAGGALIALTTDFPVAVALEDSLISTDVQILLGSVTVKV
jgi:hypothetical protein